MPRQAPEIIEAASRVAALGVFTPAMEDGFALNLAVMTLGGQTETAAPPTPCWASPSTLGLMATVNAATESIAAQNKTGRLIPGIIVSERDGVGIRSCTCNFRLTCHFKSWRHDLLYISQICCSDLRPFWSPDRCDVHLRKRAGSRLFPLEDRVTRLTVFFEIIPLLGGTSSEHPSHLIGLRTSKRLALQRLDQRTNCFLHVGFAVYK